MNQTSYDSEYDDSDKQIHGQVLAELANYMEQMASKERMHAFKLVETYKRTNTALKIGNTRNRDRSYKK